MHQFLSIRLFPWCLILLFLGVSLTLTKSQRIPNAAGPIIGIVTQPCQDENGFNDCIDVDPSTKARSFIPASYVKWLESAGARVTIIPWYLSRFDKIAARNYIQNLNGILFTGGSSVSVDSEFQQSINEIIFDFVQGFNDKHADSDGEIIPLFGTCEGFENIAMAFSKKPLNILTQFKADNLALKNEWSKSFDELSKRNNSIVFGLKNIPLNYKRTIYHIFKNESISFHEHSLGISIDDWYDDEYLSGNFTLLSKSYDSDHREFVSMLDSKQRYEYNIDNTKHRSNNKLFPGILATQFHSEKISYEWNGYFYSNMIHNISAVISNNYIAQVFVEKCRQSNTNNLQLFENGVYYDSYVIYRFDTEFTGNRNNSLSSSMFDEWYLL